MEYRLNKDQLKDNNEIVNIRTLLHKYVYTNDFINIIANELQSSIELFSITIDSNIITLKIKKTILKKNSDYQHDSLYYYQLINQILLNVYCNNMQYIYDKLYTSGELDNHMINYITTELCNIFTIPLLYNITALADNIVVLYL